VLKSLARTIESLVEYDTVERVFERREARARRQASVLGCHRLLVLDAAHFLWHMEDWARRKCRDEPAHPTVRVYGNTNRRSRSPPTQLVLNLLLLLGLRPRGEPGARFPPDPDMHAGRHEPLWMREYGTEGLSARGGLVAA
jgi:hypothetical protein